jgi:hypothetical protein
VAAKWETFRLTPTLNCPWWSLESTEECAASSTRAIITGVANTSAPPLPRCLAVWFSPTPQFCFPNQTRGNSSPDLLLG